MGVQVPSHGSFVPLAYKESLTFCVCYFRYCAVVPGITVVVKFLTNDTICRRRKREVFTIKS